MGHVITLRIEIERLFWLFRVYSKCSHMYLAKRESERRVDTPERKRQCDHMANFGVMQPQEAKECWQSLESGRGEK